MTTSSALDPACSRYLLTGLMNGTLMVHDTHCTKSEHVAGITRTVFPLVGASSTSNRTKNTRNAGVSTNVQLPFTFLVAAVKF